MESLDETQLLRQELLNARQKLQGYADTNVSLHAELRTLKESICESCRQKLLHPNHIPSQTTGCSSQFQRTRTDAQPITKREVHSTPTFSRPTLPKRMTIEFQSPKTKQQSPSRIPRRLSSKLLSASPKITKGNIKPTAVKMSPLLYPTTESDAPRCFAKRDSHANPGMQTTFVHSFDLKEKVWSVCFSADGKYLALAHGNPAKLDNGSVVIYDVETHQVSCRLIENCSQYTSRRRPIIKSLCFSPNGRYVVAGEIGHRVIVWDIPNKRIRSIFAYPSSPTLNFVDLSPSGRLVSSASGAKIQITNMRDGSTKAYSDDGLRSSRFRTVKFSPNGRHIAAGNDDGIVRMWSVRTGRLIKKWMCHQTDNCSLNFTPDGKGLLTAGPNNLVRYWDISFLDVVLSDQGSALVPLIYTYTGHTKPVYCVSVSADGRFMASTSDDNTGILWDVKNGKPQFTLIGREGSVITVHFSPAGTYLALGNWDRHVTLWKYEC